MIGIVALFAASGCGGAVTANGHVFFGDMRLGGGTSVTSWNPSSGELSHFLLIPEIMIRSVSDQFQFVDGRGRFG